MIERQPEPKKIYLVKDSHLESFKEALTQLADSVRAFNNKFDPHSFSNEKIDVKRIPQGHRIGNQPISFQPL